MSRASLISLLQKHHPSDESEKAMLTEMIKFVEENENCFERSLLIGHVTASALVVSNDRTQVLLMHHKKLDKWLQPGGHCDGDSDTLAVACKETKEETGLKNFTASKQIFDVDIHRIPQKKDIPAHWHYDIRYLIEADNDEKIERNNESNDVKWIPLEKIADYNADESVLRMIRKAIKNTIDQAT